MSEIVSTASEARSRVDRIKFSVDVVWQLVVESYQSRDWLALGYTSWDDLCRAEFGSSRLRLPREERAEQVASLRESGLSLRAIASATGVSHQAVANDLGVKKLTPAPVITVDRETGEIVAESRKVVGIDGKSYTAPVPSAPRAAPRKPITDQFVEATYEVTKAVERIARLMADDRFPHNAEKVAHRNRGDLLRAQEALAGALELLAVEAASE